MKNYLLLFSALVLIFSSCSSSRYGHVPKGNKHKVQVAKHKSKYSKKESNKLTTLEVKKADLNVALANAKLELENVNLPAPVKSKTEATKRNDKKSEVKANVFKQNKAFALSPPAINKILKKNGQSGLDKVQAERSWLYYLIVGVILILVASLLVGLIGYIFYVAGVIALVLAILALFGII